MISAEQQTEMDGMLAAIDAEFAASVTPDDLRAKFVAFVKSQGPNIDRLRVTLLATSAWWLVKGREAGHDPDVLDQIALQEMQAAISIICRAMKLRQGQPFSPARIAIVAYKAAESVGAADMKAELVNVEAIAGSVDDLASEVEKDRDRLRELIEEIADMDVGDIEMEHREIIARCRAEVASWDADEEIAA